MRGEVRDLGSERTILVGQYTRCLRPSHHVTSKSNLDSVDSYALLDGMGNMGGSPSDSVFFGNGTYPTDCRLRQRQLNSR